MKSRIMITALLLTTSVAAFAQETIGEKYDRAMEKYPTRVGFKAGPNAANMTIDNGGTINDRRSVPAWHAGVFVDIPLLPVISLQPAVLLNSKGSKYTVGDDESGNYTEISTRPLYVEVPVNVIAKIPLPNKVKLFAGAGPYMAVGVGGKNKLEGKLLGASFSRNDKIEYSNDGPSTGTNGSSYNGNLKRFDFGLNFLAGIEISHLMLSANYGYGLVNIKPGSGSNNSKYQNRVFALSIGALL
jgi:hypothetical protein